MSRRLPIRRRLLLLRAALAAPAIIASRRAFAGGSITLVVAAAPGSTTDQAARAFAPFLERHVPSATVWIMNRPGNGGLNGLRELARSEPDGHTIGWAVTPTLPARCVDHPGASSLMRDLRLIGSAAVEPIAFVRSGGNDEVTIATLIANPAASSADASTAGKPGGVDARTRTFATPPAGSPAHLAALSFLRLTRAPLAIIPFPSAAAACEAAVAGNVAGAAIGLADAIDPIRAGGLTAMALSARARFDELPDAPLLRELDVDLAAQVHHGLAAPAALPAMLADKFAAALADVVDDPEFHEEGASSGFTPQWTSGRDWTAQALIDRAGLAAVWKEAPWLPANNG